MHCATCSARMQAFCAVLWTYVENQVIQKKNFACVKCLDPIWSQRLKHVAFFNFFPVVFIRKWKVQASRRADVLIKTHPSPLILTKKRSGAKSRTRGSAGGSPRGRSPTWPAGGAAAPRLAGRAGGGSSVPAAGPEQTGTLRCARRCPLAAGRPGARRVLPNCGEAFSAPKTAKQNLQGSRSGGGGSQLEGGEHGLGEEEGRGGGGQLGSGKLVPACSGAEVSWGMLRWRRTRALPCPPPRRRRLSPTCPTEDRLLLASAAPSSPCQGSGPKT